MIKIICVGKLKEKYLKEAGEDYQKRLQKYTKIQIIELPDEKVEEKAKIKEAERICKVRDFGSRMLGQRRRTNCLIA